MALVAAAIVFASLCAAGEPLFNGRDLHGWEFLPATARGFSVRDGILRTGGDKGLLWYTREKIGNATLRVVFRMSNGNGNSGVFIRIPQQPRRRLALYGHAVLDDESESASLQAAR
jgi:hypothetical protein